MIVIVKKNTPESSLKPLKEVLETSGFKLILSTGDYETIIHVIGDTTSFDAKQLYAFDFVDKVIPIQKPYKKVDKKRTQPYTPLVLNEVTFSNKFPLMIAGPCSVESKEQINNIAKAVKKANAHVLRGGAYKPRTSPYAFQGLQKEGLILLHDAAKANNLLSVSEIVSKDDLALFEHYVDIIQVGARNMQNYDLLKALAKTKKPIILKRGFANTVEEWLMSAEYLMQEGKQNIILCERGIRTFETSMRNTLDLASLLVAKKLSHLPVIVDPSHAAGSYEYIDGLSKASIAAGADGLMIEVHHDPTRALSDGAQSLKPDKYHLLTTAIKKLVKAL